MVINEARIFMLLGQERINGELARRDDDPAAVWELACELLGRALATADLQAAELRTLQEFAIPGGVPAPKEEPCDSSS